MLIESPFSLNFAAYLTWIHSEIFMSGQERSDGLQLEFKWTPEDFFDVSAVS